jgi:hypothetical protein
MTPRSITQPAAIISHLTDERVALIADSLRGVASMGSAVLGTFVVHSMACQITVLRSATALCSCFPAILRFGAEA